jgi:hypothetical protein
MAVATATRALRTFSERPLVPQATSISKRRFLPTLFPFFEGLRPLECWARGGSSGSRVCPRISARRDRRRGPASRRLWQGGSRDGCEGVRGQGTDGESESPANPQPSPQPHTAHAESASEAVPAQAKPRSHLGSTEAPSRRVGNHEVGGRRESSSATLEEESKKHSNRSQLRSSVCFNRERAGSTPPTDGRTLSHRRR